MITDKSFNFCHTPPLTFFCGIARTVFLNNVWMQIGGSLAGEVDSNPGTLIRSLTGIFGSVEMNCSAAGFTRSEYKIADVEKSLGRRAAMVGLMTAHLKGVIFAPTLFQILSICSALNQPTGKMRIKPNNQSLNLSSAKIPKFSSKVIIYGRFSGSKTDQNTEVKCSKFSRAGLWSSAAGE